MAMEEKNNSIVSQGATQSLFQDACIIIDQAQAVAYRQVNETLIKRNWLLGMRIQHEVLKDKRAEYGEQVVKTLAIELIEKYGKGFSRNNLYRFVAFFKSFPDFFSALSEQSEIVPSLTGQSEKVPSLTGLLEISDIYGKLKPIRPLRLSWTHYSIILQDTSLDARYWYEQEAAREMWSTVTEERGSA